MPVSAEPPVLVIKLGAFGDFVQAFGAFQAIRRHHAASRLVLLTVPAYAPLARASGLFDHILENGRPRARKLRSFLTLWQAVRRERFGRVYDLQNSTRSCAYFHLLWPVGKRPDWSGTARGCSHPHDDPARMRLHSMDRLRAQLRLAGIGDMPEPQLDWLNADIRPFGLPPGFALLAPGSAPRHPAKRWPAASYAEIARRLAAAGLTPVVAGSEGEQALGAEITRTCPAAVNLAGRTDDQCQLAGLARRAACAIGNDTGPMHLAAALGCPSLVLFSGVSDPDLSCPRGPAVDWLRADPISGLSPDKVWSRLASLCGPPSVPGGGVR